MENLKVFPTDEFIDDRIKKAMDGNTCRSCANRITLSDIGSYCKMHKSNMTRSGLLRVRVNQPACIRYEKRD